MAVLDYQYDPRAVPPLVKELIDVLMDMADKRESMKEWVKCFSSDAYIWRNGKESKGTEEISKMIEESWLNVKSRNHCPEKIFVFSESEVIVDGHTDYFWEDGRAQVGKWASRMKIVEEDGKPKISEYAVVFIAYK